jgi:hypothetical protein
MKKLILAVPFVMALAFSPAAYAQQQEGLVTVNVSNNEILEELQLSAPVDVQVPIGIAANVCGIDANVIAEQRKDDENWSCEAENTSQAFANLVSRQQN